MASRALATLVLALSLCGAAHAATLQPIADTIPSAERAPETDIAIGVQMSGSSRMLAKVTIGGAGPYRFVVDTAAERSVIDKQLAADLGLESVGRGRVASMTSVQEVDLVRVPDLSFLAGEKNTLHAFAMDGQHIGAVGVLGIDVLRGRRVVLDFEAREMRIGPPPREAGPPRGGEVMVRGKDKLGQLVLIDASVDGQEVDVIVDSGMEVTVGNAALRRVLNDRRRQFEPIVLASVTGETYQADYTTVDKLKIGGVNLEGMPIAFAEPQFFARMQLTERPALLLGMDALKLFRRVVIDFEHRRAYFLPPKNAPTRGLG